MRSGGAGLTVTKSADAKDADLTFRWVRQEYLTTEQKEVLTVVARVANNSAMASGVMFSVLVRCGRSLR